MPEALYFLLQELVLLWIELRAGFSEPLKHFSKVKQVLLERAANHDPAIQVHET
jgi:hypothetical protein